MDETHGKLILHAASRAWWPRKHHLLDRNIKQLGYTDEGKQTSDDKIVKYGNVSPDSARHRDTET